MTQSSKGRGVGNFSKPLAGSYELLLTNQERSESGEDHRTLRSLESLLFHHQPQKDEELLKEANSSISRPKELTGNDPSFGERRTGSINQLQKSPKTSPKDVRRNREVPR
ncbi:hypothetical protein O181_084726 [Austropuccinia psidii MF-1]|uniref:Uncharacterized protein n=1 Tax=Austropuccinia psidii MF-1 TaxID=1389203 RepID=A0A9Q3FRJ3_9BASI|nr:hypothetical protein [Austropuccinia psidii MF-1]